ncbi:MAG TPA: anti-sigma factor [Dehalococcoidia bacterium]|nr:anti-sigma factor [Dehalococcoidia bacterium]
MRCDEVLEAAEAYALGASDAAERDDLERHLEVCATCRDLVERTMLATASLALAAPLRPAPRLLRSRLLRQIELERESPLHTAPLKRLFAGEPGRDDPLRYQVSGTGHTANGRAASRRHWPWAQSLAAAVAVLLFAGCALWIARLQSQMSRLQARSQTLQRITTEFEGQRSALLLLASEGSVRLQMQPMDPSSGVTGAVIWNPDRHKCSILVSGLPAAAADQTYHIWLVGNQRSWDSGELSTSGTGTAERTLDLNTMSSQAGYQVVVSLQQRRSNDGGNWQPVLKAWVGIQ